MQVSPFPSSTAYSRPAEARRSTGRLAALAGAGLIGLSTLAATAPAMAQFKPGEPTLQTPYGRAPLTFADIVERVKPAVLSIHVSSGGKEQTASKFPGIPNLPDDHPLNEFFKNLPKEFRGGPRGKSSPRGRPSLAQGSGFFVSADGYVVTNNHVIDGASKIMVSQDGREKLEADLIGTDARTDIALLKVKTKRSFPFVKFASKKVRAGDWVIAVGNPFGLGGTVTAGIVSALGRDIGSGPYDYLQIDAAVNKGNSGGPTFNLDGEVVGVNTAIYSPSGGNVGIAFAVPAITAAAVIEQLKSSGSVSRGWLGVKIQNIDDDTAASLGLKVAKGALVSEVTEGGPASKYGLKARDAIVGVNDDPVDDSRDLARKIADLSPNSVAAVKVMRDGREQVVRVTLGTFPKNPNQVAKAEDPAEPKTTGVVELGLKLASLDKTAGKSADGVRVTEVDGDSNAAEKGIKAGDVIIGAGALKVNTPEDVAKAVAKAKRDGLKAVLLTVKSGGSGTPRFVGVRFGKSKGKG